MSDAFIFPGQGSQSVGMLAEVAGAHAEIGQAFAEASDVLGYDLWRLVQDGPEPDLNMTSRTQPALLAAGVGVWRVLMSAGVDEPAVMAGHSLGEYTALTCAGAIGFADAVRLVEQRGILMQEAVPAGSGAMAAVLGLDDEAVMDVCEQARGAGTVSAANFNSPGQVVIAGESAAVAQAVELAKAAGAKRSVMLPVSVPSHCELMRPAADRLLAELEAIDISAPSIPVIHNVDAARKEAPDAIREALARQLYLPVQWSRCIQAMLGMGTTRFIECGPGKVLTGLLRRIDRSAAGVAAGDGAGIEAVINPD